MGEAASIPSELARGLLQLKTDSALNSRHHSNALLGDGREEEERLTKTRFIN